MKEEINEEAYWSRETFAHYGLAMYFAQSLEKSLGIWITFTLTKDREITKFQFDYELEEMFKNTFGGLILIIKNKGIGIESGLMSKLEKALMERNHLAHHYWWEHSISSAKMEGKQLILDELKDLRNFFNELDEEITNLTDQFAETKGVTKEIIQEHYEALLAGPMILFEQKRLLKKKELLIEIGRLYPDQNRKMYTPIFTFEDNSKWALGDAGFAYAPEIIESNYQIEENYLPLLPTLIETKAKNYEPWQYNLNLDNGYVLCVNKIDTLSGISFTYTIKKK